MIELKIIYLIKSLSKNIYFNIYPAYIDIINRKLDLAFNNVKPKDWYFVLD